ncbi:MAG: acetoin utilization protein AcuC [Kiritimatiellae bacterium]|nr:acetoin utilization protein AcuC [Kiritimatiellia bacterium]
MKQPGKKVFIYSPDLDKGGYPPSCPFDSTRPGRTRAVLASMRLLEGADRQEVAPERLDRTTLETFHEPDYLDILERAGRGEISPEQALEAGLGTADCPIFRDMFQYLTLACGGAVTGARLILNGDAEIVFTPSGGFHHAHPARASGFCYINDVVLAALELTAAGRRVVVLDVDVHHCDGVQEAFYHRNDVLTISMHESGRTLFPGTGFEKEMGEGPGYGYTVNLPLPVGTYDGAYLRAFREVVLPLIRAFDPDVIMLELGMDGLAGDPLAHLHLTNNAYADVTQAMVNLNKPLLATGGGGYHVENTVRGWALCWSVMCGEQSHHDEMMLGMGGVFLETTEWFGGLRDRILLSDAGIRAEVDTEIDALIERLKRSHFPIHGLAPD